MNLNDLHKWSVGYVLPLLKVLIGLSTHMLDML